MSEAAFTPLEPACASSEAGGAKHPRRAARNVLVVDCHDSFVYNLVQLVREGGAVPHLVSCDEVPLETIDHYDRVLLSPGPGLPCESARLFGHQAIAEVFGGQLRQLSEVYHGVASECRVVADEGLFAGLPRPFVVGRYHSWVVDRDTLPACLEITALSADGAIMALRHRTLDVCGVQFHPESILTPGGSTIMSHWLCAEGIVEGGCGG